MVKTRISQTVRLELMDGRKGSALVGGTPTVVIFASRAFVRQDDSMVYIEHTAQHVAVIDIDVEQQNETRRGNSPLA